MISAVDKLYGLVWGLPTLVLILGTGLLLSIQTGFAQIRYFPAALRLFVRRLTKRERRSDGISSFQALCTALSATVGIGNLAGVAGAITLGGPGSIFWMWVCALLGMVIKFAEATLALHYRHRNADGEAVGGPMYMIAAGMGEKWRPLAAIYSFFGVVAAFGVGNATQISALVDGIREAATAAGAVPTPAWNVVIGLLLAVLIGSVLFGGATRIAQFAERLIPFAAGGYILLSAAVLVLRADALPGALAQIMQGAFSPRAVTGGTILSAFTVMRIGVSRGVFTNEAGMGTASIAHAAADVAHPAEQGLMGIVEVFLDTVVICSLTALAILCSGVPIEYGTDCGAALTARAFTAVLGNWAGTAIAAALCLFAFATVLGWGLYGTRCAEYLFGDTIRRKFAAVQTAAVLLGAVVNTAMLWRMAEIVNGLMAIPNLIALWALTPQLKRIIRNFDPGRSTADGGTYENIHQREPLRAVADAEIPSACGGGGKRGENDLPSEHRTARSAYAARILSRDRGF